MSKDTSEIYKIRHSLCHLMSMAIVEIYPKAGLGVGPAIDDGFYQDYDLPEPLNESVFPKIEKRMREMIRENIAFQQHNMSFEEALKFYGHDPYKSELIRDLKEVGEKNVSFYKSGFFENLCLGPHVVTTKEINPDAFKLTSVAGSYWRGNEKNKMLTRIYGIAFNTKQELEAHLKMLEEAKKRDHRKLGKELDLFTFSDLVGPGLPLWTPRGTIMREELNNFVWELRRAKGYEKVTVPHITKRGLYQTSGHWEKFFNELFKIQTREGHEYAMKPMNCPHHTQIFCHLQRSYRDMPQRYAETTMVYRDEQSGELSGLARVLCITQDDAHVFCRYNQVKEEFLKIWDIIDRFYSTFGFKLRVRLSLHDPKEMNKYLGTPEIWKSAENSLRDIAKERGANYYEAQGEAAMYGPKIDFMANDSLGREHQVATIQLDMNLPERFDLFCINEKGEHERVVMIHAAIMGSIERFMSVLIEHTAGVFPVWLTPTQVAVIPVGDKHAAFSRKIGKELVAAGIRVEVLDQNETVGYKIRYAQKMKIPYNLVVGDQEVKSKKFAVRLRGQEKLKTFTLEKLIERITREIAKRK